MDEYVFRESGDRLEFVGNFEELYRNDPDPWNQSGTAREEYGISRRVQSEILGGSAGRLLDIGCGLGHTTNIFSKLHDATGLDISQTAVQKASKNYPRLKFVCADICDPNFHISSEKFDCVVLNQLLWYVLPNFSTVLKNCEKLISGENSIILLSNFLFPSVVQRYGREYFEGIEGVVSWMVKNLDGFRIEEYRCRRLTDKYYDFHITFRPVN